MHRLGLTALVVVLGPAVATAEPARPARPAGFVDFTLGVGAMYEAPADIAGLLGVAARGGWWVPGTNLGFEGAVDGGMLLTPDPDGYDTVSWSSTSAWRLRAMAGVRFTTNPSQRTVYFGRLLVGAERISVSTTERIEDVGGDIENHQSGSDIAPAIELGAGYLVDRGYGLEAAVSRVSHRGDRVGAFHLSYDAIEVELRFVIGLPL